MNKAEIQMQLNWHRYKYYPYEYDFARREVQSLLDPHAIQENAGGLNLERPGSVDLASRLVYFAGYSQNAGVSRDTSQSVLERINGNGVKRQSTRYSAHGLHEYKGKFNPQVAKALLNIFNARPGQLVLDPFCGSGTSLVECAHLGISSVGTDINPLAVFLANAKLQSLSIPAEKLLADSKLTLSKAKKSKAKFRDPSDRGDYLRSWFPENYLSEIERLRLAIESEDSPAGPVLLAIASNLLREYSLQEPSDLRIRRRTSPFPQKPFFDAYEDAVNAFGIRMAEAQLTLGVHVAGSKAINIDCKKAFGEQDLLSDSFDLVLTSPPYATALPYIDTQRLSLVWLKLLPPSEILLLESELVGSREIRGTGKKSLLDSMQNNDANLPALEAEFCIELQNSLGESDGFRRQVVPRLLYRYFTGMADAFSAVRRLTKQNAPFGLIVGGNHTVLSGKRFDIETPKHLASIAAERGWEHVETVPLQTYRRYGLHKNNATTTEALILLKAGPIPG
jgi:16S rRNA G966 N2-methylase RsmD